MLSANFSWDLVASVLVSILYVPLTDSVTASSSEPSALDGNTLTVALSVNPAGVWLLQYQAQDSTHLQRHTRNEVLHVESQHDKTAMMFDKGQKDNCHLVACIAVTKGREVSNCK